MKKNFFNTQTREISEHQGQRIGYKNNLKNTGYIGINKNLTF